MAPRVRTVVLERIAGMVHARVPARATAGSACFDLAAAEAADLIHGTVTLVRTGWKMRAPRGTFLEVRPRSGLASRGVLMVNAPGTIDRDYSGEIRVPMSYLFDGTYHIEVGDRIGQIRVIEDLPARFRNGTVAPVASRRGGFGSTGR
ncbi:MAG: dUTP diphosphatase [Thermoplasmata archaeon]|jgi:dUTP pyrophosphatase|nr:dUTP diphosphatase [Thermoplasmata archaeon]